MLAHGASTQPFCIHARALTQANVPGTRVWLYLLQHARAFKRVMGFPSVYYARDFTRAVNLYAHV